MNYDIVPPNLAIKAMRSNGFKSTDYAVSELIDNSIQAAIQANHAIARVDVVCVERRISQNGRMLPRIQEIIIADDAGGMELDTLRRALMFGAGTNLTPDRQKGIGKFGMGLPNASISQCKLVEVYSWRDDKCYFTSLDVNKIENNELKEVPEPTITQLPEELKKYTDLATAPAGTIIIWKELDKTTWTRHQAFFKNSEFLVGRMYRKFIDKGRAKICFKAFQSHADGQIDELDVLTVRPNDPLMLMENTSAPAPYDKEPAFTEFRPASLEIELPNGEKSRIDIRFSVAKQQTRESKDGVVAGNMPHGKYAARNVGVSIVRADRELELNTSWVKPGDLTERWWGAEISFQPDLDEIFGVTNNKQAANNLYRASASEDAANLGIKQRELEQELYEAEDPKLFTYQVSALIDSALSTLRSHIGKQNSGAKAGKNEGKNEAEKRASRVTKLRNNEGATAQSDDEREKASKDERRLAIEQGYKEAGVSDDDAKRLAIQKIEDDVRFNFVEARLSSPAIFDVSSELGEYFIKFNNRHPAFSQFIQLLESDEDESRAFIGLKMLLCAWARMEDEAADRDREDIEEIRLKWGQVARNYMREPD